MQIFFTKMSINQPRKVQIPKFWCLKSLINISLQLSFSWLGQKIALFSSYRGKKCQKPSKLGNILVFEKGKLHFLKIPFGFDFKLNYSDMYECNGGQNYENLIWELLSLLDAVLDRRVSALSLFWSFWCLVDCQFSSLRGRLLFLSATKGLCLSYSTWSCWKDLCHDWGNWGLKQPCSCLSLQSVLPLFEGDFLQHRFWGRKQQSCQSGEDQQRLAYICSFSSCGRTPYHAHAGCRTVHLVTSVHYQWATLSQATDRQANRSSLQGHVTLCVLWFAGGEIRLAHCRMKS